MGNLLIKYTALVKMVPKLEGQGSMGEECEAHFNNLSMFAFNSAILVRSIGASESMKDAL